MIIGNKSEFAIEYELAADYGGVWMFGMICYYIKGKQIGDYELGTSLRDVMFHIHKKIRDNGKRIHEELFHLSKFDLFNRLNEVLYGYKDSEYEEVGLKEMWARFDIVPRVDIFDESKVFLVEDKNQSRIVFKEGLSQGLRGIHEAYITKGAFDRVIFETYKQLDNIYDLELMKQP
ncbi:MAG TPA: hypothetical protein DEF42_02730 [Desulfosporosinus sp.]|nr:hypothetical protein [Desulfosporosinus sp.]